MSSVQGLEILPIAQGYQGMRKFPVNATIGIEHQMTVFTDEWCIVDFGWSFGVRGAGQP